MTREEFLAFYPQFSSFTPGVVLTEYIRQANARFGDFGEDTEEARRLYAAHRLTLYAFTVPQEGASVTMAMIASAGKAQGASQVASKKVGEVQITYSNSSNSTAKVSSELADLAETEFGVQLLTLIRQHSFTRYVP